MIENVDAAPKFEFVVSDPLPVNVCIIYPGDVVNVELNHYTEWYYGKHEEIDNEAPNSVKGIVL